MNPTMPGYATLFFCPSPAHPSASLFSTVSPPSPNLAQDHSVPFRFLSSQPCPLDVTIPTSFEDSDDDSAAFSDWLKDMEQKVASKKSELNAVAVTFLSNPNKV
jgi:hypothetical protein